MLSAKLSGKPPVLTTKEIAIFSGLQHDFVISKSKNELGFKPKAPEIAVKEALDFLMEHKNLL